MKIASKGYSLVGAIALVGWLFLSGCEVIDTLTPGMDLLTQEVAELDGDDEPNGGGGEALNEGVDCDDAVPCGMAMNDRDLPCSAIDGGICVEGCCEPGECKGPNEDFYRNIGHDGCPPRGQGEVDENGCCIRGQGRGRSGEAPGHFCPDGPSCRDDHPSGFDLPCVAINGGECVDGCCEPGPCKGPTCTFLHDMEDECDGTCDPISDCCIPDDGGDDGVDGDGTGGDETGGDSTGTGTADGPV